MNPLTISDIPIEKRKDKEALGWIILVVFLIAGWFILGLWGAGYCLSYLLNSQEYFSIQIMSIPVKILLSLLASAGVMGGLFLLFTALAAMSN